LSQQSHRFYKTKTSGKKRSEKSKNNEIWQKEGLLTWCFSNTDLWLCRLLQPFEKELKLKLQQEQLQKFKNKSTNYYIHVSVSMRKKKNNN
jgi:hypothetical protein